MTESAPFRSPHAQDNGFSPRPGFQPFALADAESSIPARLRAVASRHPDAIAVVDGPVTLSYAALLDRTQALAAALALHLDDSSGPVAIVLPFGLPVVETLLAALFAGRSYLTIDPAYPDAHIASLLAAAVPAAVLTEEPQLERLRSLAPSLTDRLLPIDAITPNASAPPLPTSIDPRSVACLFATSGSTGEPKLVALSHRAVLFDIGRQTNDLYLGPDDRFDLLFSFAFSASLAPIFGALLNGAQLHLLDLRDRLDRLPTWLVEHAITVSTLSVSTLRSLLAGLSGPDACPAVRLVSVGGEPLLPGDVDRFHQTFHAGCVLQNAMAATETRTYAQYFVPRGRPTDDPAPIGWPVAGKPVLLLDDDGRPAPPGESGEIAVQSQFLASGYQNAPDTTRARFLPQPDGTILYRTGDRGRFLRDGSLEFLGRNDALVKIRGHRVELLAVERALARHPGITSVVVLAREDVPGDRRLVAYYSNTAHPAPIAEVRSRLRAELPEYMIPSAFVPLETFPLLPNGKIDRRALPPPRMVPDPSTMASVSPRDPLEFQLHQIWKRTLDAPSFGIHDDFFDLGGDSLKAADVIRAIGQTFPTDLPITALNTAPTIAELAATLRAANAEAAPLPSLHTLKPGRGAHTLFLSHNVLGGTSLYAPLARRIPDEIAVVGVEPLTSGTTLVRRTRLTEMAADFVAQIQRVQPEGPYHVGGLCAGGMIAFEAALQLEADGHDVALVALIDTVNPREWARRDTLSERLRRFKRTLRAAGGSGPLRPLRQARAIARSIRKFARHEPPRRLRQLVKRLRCNQLRAAVDRGSSTPAFAQNLTGPELYAFAEQTYSPTRPLHAPAILFRATAEPDAAGQRFDNPTLGWHHWTGGGLTVVDIPAGHITMLREPHVATLANHLADRIEDPAQPSTTPRLAVPTL